MTADVIPGATVTPAVARAIIDQARASRYPHGVLGLRASPAATRQVSFTHRDQPVQIVPAASALAVREAIRQAEPSGWLVVVTDRSDDDLGPGLLAQFVWQRLRHPNPWQAVQQRFSANGVDAKLLQTRQAREVATGLLELSPPDGWPPAPAGVLTRDHALGCVARTELGLPDGPVDLITVLHWSTQRGLAATIARLRARAGEATVDAVLDWIAEAAGEAAPLVAALLRAGNPSDIVPLGVVLDCLLQSPTRQDAELALARLEHRWGDVPRAALQATARLSGVVVTGLLGGRATVENARQVLVRADELLTEAQALPLAGASRLLPSGLTQRLRALAGTLRTVPNDDPVRLEAAWAKVTEHELSEIDPRVAPARAGVQLARWLRTPDAPAATLAELAGRHLAVDAWVDSAVNDAETGVDEHSLAAALEHVLRQVQQRRDDHDLVFAAALAREGGGGRVQGLVGLEDLLPEVVVPLARKYPTLLLVLDGMSAGVATEILTHATLEFDLQECLLPGATARTPALAVLPTVTEFSRASLLCGRLTSGQQDAERTGFEALAQAHGLGEVKLIHKKGLDSSRQGFELADDVRQAISDVDRYKLVGCVLNTIDDALDRTDPGGTDWTAETVKHLAPLLRAAMSAGRLVVLTSDHGHVVERRRGTQRGTGVGGRYRAATSGPVEADEVLASGPRVLTPDHQAVLAVNERLRYGPLKAGYHGGAAPAEAVVPVALLTPSTLVHDLVVAPVAEPDWWETAGISGGGGLGVLGANGPASAPSGRVARVKAPERQPDLFSEPEPVPAGDQPGVGAALVASATYRAQKSLVGRLGVTDEAIATLVDALASATDRRLPAGRVAPVLGVSANRVPMVMSQVAKLLNVEGYPVVSTDPATQAVTLDAALLAEQYGVYQTP